MKKALIEGLKELLRVGVIAVIPILIAGLEAGQVDWKLVLISGIIAVLKGLDKFIHKTESETKGLLPF